MHRIPYLAVICGLVVVALPSAAWAGEPRLFARAGVGAGIGTVDSTFGYEEPTATGGVLSWEGALGARVSSWLAVHATVFGALAPHARTTVDLQRGRGSFWAQSFGAGLTLAPEHGWRRWPDYRGFVSASAGLSLVDSPMTHALGAGTELAFGLEHRLRSSWWLGLALQGVFQGRNPLQLATEHGYKSGQAAVLLTLTYDPRSG